MTLPLTEDGVTQQMTDQKVEVSATGVQLTCAPRDRKNALAFCDMVLVLKEGSEIGMSGAHGCRAGEAEASPCVSSLTWKLPVDLDQAAALRLGEATVPLT